MKRFFLICALLIMTFQIDSKESSMVTVGKKAPQFTAQAVVNEEIKEISLSDYPDFYKVIIFYPLDFTFVCPTELHALQNKLQEFAKRNVLVVAISVDSVYSHLAWLSTPKSKGGIQGIQYPLISDLHKEIATAYGVLDESGVALRGTFILDRENIVQCAMINNLPLGRNVDEILRLVDAMQHVEKHGDVCPANWMEGQEAMQATHEGVATYLGTRSEHHLQP